MIINFRKITITTILALLTSACILAPVWSAEYRSVTKEGVNLRSAPGTDKEVLFELPAGYPLKVLSRDGSWMKVEDFEKDKGWISETMVRTTPTVITTAATVNIRSGPSAQDRVIGTAARGTIFIKQDKKGDWVKVSHPSLQGDAWISQGLLWPN